MSKFSWNSQGLGLPWKVQFLHDVVRQERLTFVFLCETISSREKMEWICTKLGFEGLIKVEPRGRSGGLALLWQESDQASLTSFSFNHIDVETNVNNMRSWRLTGVYGEPNKSKRKKTWDLLRNLASDSNLPWAVVGDMNNIVAHSDKKGGASYPQWLVDGFNDILQDTMLIDMELVGHQYTWERGRGTAEWMEVRLDRVLTNQSWLTLFPFAKLYNMEGSPSNYSLLYLDLRKPGESTRRRKFRFENAWIADQCVNRW